MRHALGNLKSIAQTFSLSNKTSAWVPKKIVWRKNISSKLHTKLIFYLFFFSDRKNLETQFITAIYCNCISLENSQFFNYSKIQTHKSYLSILRTEYIYPYVKKL